MKKNVFTRVLPMALILLCMISLTACGGSSGAEGTYKFQSMESMADGQKVTLDDLAEEAGMSADEITFNLVLKSDGTFSLDASVLDDSMSEEGTWEEDGGDLTLTSDGTSVSATLEGGRLTLSEDGLTMVFEK